MELSQSILLPAAAVVGAIAVSIGLAVAYGRRSSGHSIRVVAVGGGGTDAVDSMIRAKLRGADYVAVDTDRHALDRAAARTKVVLGGSLNEGHGAGGSVSNGELAAREAADDLAHALAGSELVMIVAGLGGGTGSGAAPVVAEVARQQGALTMAVVTEPFKFEGARRREVAQRAMGALARNVEAIATVANDRVREAMPADITADEAFRSVGEVMRRNVGELLDLLVVRGRINLDLADIKSLLQDRGAAAVGFGRASGADRAANAAHKALSSTMLGSRLNAATSVLVNVTGSRNLKLTELDVVTETVLAAVARGADLTFGMALQPRLRNDLQVTLLVTGYEPVRATAPEAGKVAESNPWRPVWLRRATEAAPSPPGIAPAPPAPTEPAETEPQPDAAPVAAAAPSESSDATAAAPRSRREKRAAARAARQNGVRDQEVAGAQRQKPSTE